MVEACRFAQAHSNGEAAATAKATYAQSIEPAVRWLVESIRSENWRERLPQLAAYHNDHFDYQADERALQLRGAVSLAA